MGRSVSRYGHWSGNQSVHRQRIAVLLRRRRILRRSPEQFLKELFVLLAQRGDIDTQRFEGAPAEMVDERVRRDINLEAGSPRAETELVVLEETVPETLVETADLLDDFASNEHAHAGNMGNLKPLVRAFPSYPSGILR